MLEALFLLIQSTVFSISILSSLYLTLSLWYTHVHLPLHYTIDSTSLHGIGACGSLIQAHRIQRRLPYHCSNDLQFASSKENKKFNKNTQMGSALPTKKLDNTNFASWEYKMHQYLVGQGYWSYIEGAHENQPNLTHVEPGSRPRAVCCIAWHHAYMIICWDISKKQKRRNRRGKISRRFS